MAAAYAFHIAQNQPFIDGNKRTGLLAALVFLDLNGVELTDLEGCLYDGDRGSPGSTLGASSDWQSGREGACDTGRAGGVRRQDGLVGERPRTTRRTELGFGALGSFFPLAPAGSLPTWSADP